MEPGSPSSPRSPQFGGRGDLIDRYVSFLDRSVSVSVSLLFTLALSSLCPHRPS